MTTIRFTASDDRDLDDFYADLAGYDLQPLWLQEGLMPRRPPLADVAHAWSWKRLRDLAERAGDLVPVERGGDRRVLSLCNPGLGGRPFATTTLWAAVQYLAPGEVAPSHRHSPAAFRFVLEGQGVSTLVDGQPIAMHPGDLILTPSGTWHEHQNLGAEPMLWFDGLDLPLVRALDVVFFEPGDAAPLVREPTLSTSEQRYGLGPGLVPDAQAASPASPLLVYRWADTDAALRRLLADSEGSALVRFVDPTSGRDALPTLRCAMQRIRSGVRVPTTRRTGSSVVVVYRGAVTAVVGGRQFSLAEGDVLAVPSWEPYDVAAEDDADLFVMSDAPVLEALGLHRSETWDEPQQVQS